MVHDITKSTGAMAFRSPILLFIPAYNCEKQITRVLGRLEKSLPSAVTEIIIVDNGSSDGTQASALEWIAAHPQIRSEIKFMKNRVNVGLGGSHKVAFNYAIRNGFKGVITLHGDDQADLGDFTEIVNRWAENQLQADAFLGSRFAAGAKLAGYSLLRTIGNRVINAIWSLLLFRRISDLGSGLNFISTEFLARVPYATWPDTLVFNPQQLLALVEKRARIVFLPISWREEDQKSNAVPWRVFISMLTQILAFKVPRLFPSLIIVPNEANYVSDIIPCEPRHASSID